MLLDSALSRKIWFILGTLICAVLAVDAVILVTALDLNGRDLDLPIVAERLEWAALLGAAVALPLAIWAGWIVSREVLRPVAATARSLAALAGDRSGEASEAPAHRDELAALSSAVARLEAAAAERRQVEDAAARGRIEAAAAERAAQAGAAQAAARRAFVDRALAAALQRFAAGALTYRLEAAFGDAEEPLRRDFNAGMEMVESTLGAIADGVAAFHAGSDQIGQVAEALFRRSEADTADLAETASALDRIVGTLCDDTRGARQAQKLVAAATDTAASGGETVHRAEGAMAEIEKSSRQVAQIISVIDEIAFQTNLLALNAGVEAARAGDAGRGFAVVAQEVRALAGRSADAAKEIKTLIQSSEREVGSGARLVGETGEALRRIIGQVKEIEGVVGVIAATSESRSAGLGHIKAVLERMSLEARENTAEVERAMSAGIALEAEAEILDGLIDRFKAAKAGRPAPIQSRPAAPNSKAPRPARNAPTKPAAPAPARAAATRTASAPGPSEPLHNRRKSPRPPKLKTLPGGAGSASRSETDRKADPEEAGWQEF